jgi:eukaryotic-like serine/threonine-protein kinase
MDWAYGGSKGSLFRRSVGRRTLRFESNLDTIRHEYVNPRGDSHLIGRMLGHYKVLEKLGEGGMGVVYKARDTHLDRFVAIKVLPKDRVADPQRKQRFILEAKAASALQHPNIIAIHDIDQADGIDYIAMEYVDGRSLDRIIGRKGMRMADTLKYGMQIADALARTHAAKIIHRDLKPSNVMVDEHGLVKVLDFGLAKLADSPETPTCSAAATISLNDRLRTEAGAVMGTIAYMSPEQAEGRAMDSRGDIFSLGVMLYEMVTGQRPFRGDSNLEILSATLRSDPLPPQQLVAELPQELERIILRCLRKDPARRFQHMEDLKVALEELHEDTISGSIVGQRAPAPAHRSGLSTRRLAVAGVLMVIALLTAGIFWWQHLRQPAEEVPLSAVPLTSSPGHVNTPNLSPDGNQVAFSWDGDQQENVDIYLKLVGAGAPLRLTTDPAQDLAPCWAPDGRSIAFVRAPANRQAAILVIPALGGPERKLAEGYFNSKLSWSPDGQWLLVSRQSAPGQPHAIGALSVNTGEYRLLTQPPAGTWLGDVMPTLAPDGHTLAFARSQTRSNSEIFLMQVSDSLEPKGQPRQLTSENRTSLYPDWTPDGREIIFSSGSGANSMSALWRIRADAPAQTHAARIPLTEGAISLTLSRQGQLVFSRMNNDENIWRMAVADGKPGDAGRFIFSTRRDVEPRYSADGSKIAFSSDRSGDNEVWISASDGSNALQLTFMKATMTGGARWSPDGQRLVFLSTQAGQQEIYLVSANGGKPVRLTDHPAHDSAPSWSRDGNWIYFASNRSGRFEVWKMPPDPKSAPIQVTRNGGFAALESVDGKALFFARAKSGDRYEIVKMPVGGGPETVVVPLMGIWGDFDVTDRGVYYIASRAAGAEIRLLSYAGQTISLGAIGKRPSFGLAVAPDNRTILYTQFDVESSELMLIEHFR